VKPFQFPVATVDLARLFRAFVRHPLHLVLFSLTLIDTRLLTAAPAKAQSYRALFAGNGATFLHRDEKDTRAMAERQPAPVGDSRATASRHHLQATPKSRRPLQKPGVVERTTQAGKRLSSGPQTHGDRVVPPGPQIR
jgi:hypothetical protein